MSLEELLQIKISTGSLTNFSSRTSPSAITTIAADQIEATSAKNLASLLENHVPGMVLMNHSEGDKLGIRGHIAAENYKLLLLVNGRNVTNQVYEGAITEIDQWDLGDIEKVEVIRGPGSVTYGSGAIAGVINIITKSSRSDLPLLSASASSLPEYNSKGANLQYRQDLGKVGIYFYGSIRDTDGNENPNYYALSDIEPTDVRYLGKRSIDSKGPQNYLADTFDRPQIKAHLDLSYEEDLSMWMRYTQSGQSHHFATFANIPNSDEDINRRQVSTRSFVISPEFKRQLTNELKIKSNITYDTQEYIRYDLSNPQWAPKHPNNIRDYAFSQNRLVASVLFDYDSGNHFKVATGYEYNTTDVRAPWGKSDDSLWIREGVHIISDADTSAYRSNSGASGRPPSNSIEEVGRGLDFETHSHVLEAVYKKTESLRFLYSHRIDIPSVSDPMFAPRLSVISELNESNTIRLTAQRSLRMMPLRAQYLFDKYYQKSSTNGIKHETLDGIELAYTRLANESLLLNFNAFYNEVSPVGFTGTDLQFLGNMRLLGFEFESKLKFGNTDLILNHSNLRLLDMTTTDALKNGLNRNNISYSDYYYLTRGKIPLLLESYGDGLNNWPENSTKLIATQRFLDDALVANVNATVHWDYGGSYDEMTVYQNAYDSFDTGSLSPSQLAQFESQRSLFERERALIEKQDAYKSDINLNASLSYRWETNSDTEIVATLYAEHLLGSTKKYYVSTGSNNYYPERLSFMEEPRTLGIRVKINFR